MFPMNQQMDEKFAFIILPLFSTWKYNLDREKSSTLSAFFLSKPKHIYVYSIALMDNIQRQKESDKSNV